MVFRLAAKPPPLPLKYSIDFLAASAVTGSPSLNLAPSRSVNVTDLLSGAISHLTARAGRNEPSAATRTSGSYAGPIAMPARPLPLKAGSRLTGTNALPTVNTFCCAEAPVAAASDAVANAAARKSRRVAKRFFMVGLPLPRMQSSLFDGATPHDVGVVPSGLAQALPTAVPEYTNALVPRG